MCRSLHFSLAALIFLSLSSSARPHDGPQTSLAQPLAQYQPVSPAPQTGLMLSMLGLMLTMMAVLISVLAARAKARQQEQEREEAEQRLREAERRAEERERPGDGSGGRSGLENS
jgi:hypothetical protein